MTDYIWMLDGEYVKECESCGSEVPLHEFDRPRHRSDQRTDAYCLCELCASSNIEALTGYDHNRDYYQMAKATAQAANFTVKKLGGFKGVKSNCPDCAGTGNQRFIGKMDGSIIRSPGACPTCKGVNV